ncbi:hypothetical protein TPHA_0N01120 [Tetrapisispora phaffii CBS 4417]|uniref:Protein RMD9, mitochondrial n=1 Tax=Tetrapisispora phaffii (strain ATCC 24235 / CBS 4417 / NBRC 1672 / NRRL Y-8282 / UCD 70-5) TaxID=1071381 RepID=G8C165_TETPH|nr:hypothetical protein TPHA_0N01120 [Tetrapisispora phaffii CBS 4417]CCE65893.1 hypothetical protein TPHA_0N01120 [Tetrapisispora phaffii CBS 4417]
MFRLAQQSQIIKGRIVSASTRNSINHSIRFNGSISLERQEDLNGPSSKYLNTGNSKVNDATDRVRHLRNQLNATGGNRSRTGTANSHTNNRNNNNNNNNNNRNKNSSKINYVSVDSPWYNQVIAFDECVSQTLYMSQTPRRKSMNVGTAHPDPNANPLFWDSINKAMKLYYDLTNNNAPEMNSARVSKLIHLLHNGLRANRNQLTRMNKKPDYDSQSFHKEMTNYLCQSLRDISKYILEGKSKVNEYGAMHLVTAFKELLLFEETVEIWRSALDENKNKELANTFLNPRVVGVILPLLYDNGVPFNEIQSLYEKSSSIINFFHPNLSVGMIRAALSAGENEIALKLFEELCEESSESKYGYLIETHLSFIGECKDLNVASAFFYKALNNEMPYKIDLQVSYVKLFLKNIWELTNDFDKVYEIWYRSVVHYGKNINHGISSSLNDTFFDIFFKYFANNKMEGFQRLQNVILTYNNIKQIDEPFFNIILTKCSIWRDRSVIDYIDKAYALYHIPKTIVAYRILLKSMGSVDNTTNEEILKRWTSMIEKTDEIGSSFIANADWAALRDATITWTQQNVDNVAVKSTTIKNEQTRTSTPAQNNSISSVNNSEELDFSHPALQAANASGAFDEFHNDDVQVPTKLTSEGFQFEGSRIELYLQIVKCYSIFCRDARQLSRLTSGTAAHYPVLQASLSKLQNLDARAISIPQLNHLKSKQIN